MVLLAVVGVAASLLVRSREGGSATGDQNAYARLGHEATIPGATTLPQIAAAVMGRYGGHAVLAVGAGAPRGPKPREGRWLHVVLAAPAEDERIARPEWEADLVQGAIADALEATTGERVVDVRLDLKLPDGTIIKDASGGGMGDILPGQNFSTASDDAIRADITAGLAGQGLAPVSIEVLRADQPAPAVVAETSNARQAAKDANETIRALFGNTPRYEGYYLEIRDGKADPVLIAAAAFRSAAGTVWLRPDVEDVASLPH